MSEWKEYTGSAEQISEMLNAKNGFIGNSEFSITKDPFVTKGFFDAEWLKQHLAIYKVTHYLIIPDDPLREMKIRQAQTGQPVWIKLPAYMIGGLEDYWNDTREYKINIDCYPPVIITDAPDWNIPNAEYSFTPF